MTPRKASQKPDKATAEMAECSLCGDRLLATDDQMYWHLMTRHPMEMLRHPRVGPRVADWAFRVGEQLAERLMK